MNFKIVLVLGVVLLTINSCNLKSSETANAFKNPAAEDFNLANSDPAAVELADSIMEAMGGWENWNNTRFISWNFFDNRNLVWDKKEERARIESLKDSITYLVNLKTVTGKVWVKGQPITERDSLNKML